MRAYKIPGEIAIVVTKLEAEKIVDRLTGNVTESPETKRLASSIIAALDSK